MSKGPGRLTLAGIGLAAMLTASAAVDAPRAQAPDPAPMTVLELFTSQGCSACPPADALLGEFARRDDVVALTLPVEYWDYLGWKDTLAVPAHGARQRAYAKSRRDNQVYTPQVVINGLAHAVGKKRGQIEAAIASTMARLDDRRVPVSIAVDKDTLIVDVGAAPNAGAKPAVIWLVLVQRAATVAIEKGENRGKTVTYHNVVRHMMPAGAWSGEATTLRLPIAQLLQGDADSCTVLLQEGKGGPILGAAKFPGQ